MSSKDQNQIQKPFSSISKRPDALHYEENLLKPNDILSTFKSKYSKFNTSTDFIKTTVSVFRNSGQLKDQIRIPLGLNISPLSNFVDESTILYVIMVNHMIFLVVKIKNVKLI